MRFKLLLFLYVALFSIAGYWVLRTTVKIPTCDAKLVVPSGCKARAWGNAVEIDCPGKSPKIYYCDTLKQESPH